MARLSTAVQIALGVLTLGLLIFVLVVATGDDSEGDDAPAAASEADPNAPPGAVALFQDNCGQCHTLASAGTEGVVGPALNDYALGTDEVLANIAEGPGQMPAGLLEGPDAQAVAELIAGDDPTLADPSEAAEGEGPDS